MVIIKVYMELCCTTIIYCPFPACFLKISYSRTNFFIYLATIFVLKSIKANLDPPYDFGK